MISIRAPDLVLKDKSKMGMEVVFPIKENIMESQDPKDKLIHSAVNNCLDPNFKENLVEGQANIPDRNEDLEIDITECSPSSESGLVDGASRMVLKLPVHSVIPQWGLIKVLSCAMLNHQYLRIEQWDQCLMDLTNHFC